MTRMPATLVSTESADFPQSWYPVSRSSDLRSGQHVTTEIFGRSWLLFRTTAGNIGMTSRRCPHMGVDLARGKVVGESIECPLHGYRFDIDGNCLNAPPNTQGSPEGVLNQLVCRERYGIVFAFLGDSPTFEIPRLPEMPAELLHSKPQIMHFDVSHYVFGFNSFDARHFSKVHNRRFVSEPDIIMDPPHKITISYAAEILKHRWVDYLLAALGRDTTRVVIDCWGSNLLAMANLDTGFGAVIAAAPLSNTRTRLYITCVTSRSEGSSILKTIRDAIAVRVGAGMVQEFLKPDIEIITGQRPMIGPLVDESDTAALKFWEYFEQLPRYYFNKTRMEQV